MYEYVKNHFAALNVVPTARIAIDHQIDMTGMNNSILAADNEGTGTEFLWGFLMGLLLGVFMLLMVRSCSFMSYLAISLTLVCFAVVFVL